jgi:hypothetical protein
MGCRKCSREDSKGRSGVYFGEPAWPWRLQAFAGAGSQGQANRQTQVRVTFGEALMAGSYRTPGRQCVSAELIRHLFHYDPETGIFRWKNPTSNHAKKGAIAGSVWRGRRIIIVGGWFFPASHIAWLYVYGEWPELELDHRNRDPLDNSIANLRDVTSSVNCGNQEKRKTNKSGFKGVHKHPQQSGWWARITANGIKYDLGLYPTAELAAGAYRIAAAGIHGDA